MLGGHTEQGLRDIARLADKVAGEGGEYSAAALASHLEDVYRFTDLKNPKPVKDAITALITRINEMSEAQGDDPEMTYPVTGEGRLQGSILSMLKLIWSQRSSTTA